MKIVALVVMLFALATAAYGVAAVFPKYQSANSEWASSSGTDPMTSRYNNPQIPPDERERIGRLLVERSEKSRKLGEERDKYRNRIQSYAMAVVGAGVVALVLGILAARKPPKGLGWAAIAGAIVSLGLVGYMQATGSIF